MVEICPSCARVDQAGKVKTGGLEHRNKDNPPPKPVVIPVYAKRTDKIRQSINPTQNAAAHKRPSSSQSTSQNPSFIFSRPPQPSPPISVPILTRRTPSATARRAARSRTARGVLALVGVLAEGQLLLELAAELAVHGDQLLADGDEGLARGEGAVRLDADLHFGDVGVGD